MATGMTIRCRNDRKRRQCTGKRLSRTIWSSFNKEGMSHLRDGTVAGPAAQRVNVLASKCEYPPFRYPPFTPALYRSWPDLDYILQKDASLKRIEGWDPDCLVQGPNSWISQKIHKEGASSLFGRGPESPQNVCCSRATQTCTGATLGLPRGRNIFGTLRPSPEKTTCSLPYRFSGKSRNSGLVPGNRDPKP